MRSGVSELALSELPAEQRRAAVVAGLKAFKKFNFYPEQVGLGGCRWFKGSS